MNAGSGTSGSRAAIAPREWLGYAWLALTLAFAIHVLDEADRDFTTIYQPLATAVRARFPHVPFPQLTFGGWLASLAVVVIVLLAISSAVFHAGPAVRRVAYAYAALMAANACAHVIGTLQATQVVAGTWSGALLLLASAVLFVAARRAAPGHRHPLSG
jgi:hypothetical protein